MLSVNKKYLPPQLKEEKQTQPKIDMKEMHAHFEGMLKNALDEHYEKLVQYAEEEDKKEHEHEEKEEEKVLKEWEFTVERDPTTMLITKISAKEK